MCYQLVYLIFDFQTEAKLKDAALVGRALTQLVENNFHLMEEGIENPVSAWTMALRKGQRSVWVGLENDNQFAVTLSVVTNNWRRLYVSADRSASTRPGAIQALVQAGEVVFETLKPDYGYGLVSLDTQLLDPPGDGDYGITTIYDYNFFSPRLVEKLGAENLKAVAAYRSVSFDDDGMLLEFSPNPLGDRKPYTATYEAAAKVLGAAEDSAGVLNESSTQVRREIDLSSGAIA